MEAIMPKAKVYEWPEICTNWQCNSPSEFRVIEHNGNPQFKAMYCPFCGKKTLACKKCGKENYFCECATTRMRVCSGASECNNARCQYHTPRMETPRKLRCALKGETYELCSRRNKGRKPTADSTYLCCVVHDGHLVSAE
jgi:hypothetical protein